MTAFDSLKPLTNRDQPAPPPLDRTFVRVKSRTIILPYSIDG